MPSRSLKQLIGGCLLAAVLAVSLAMPPDASYANGRVGEFVRRVAGPYEIALGTTPDRPAVGSLHLTMMVTEVSSGSPVLDARIIVAGKGPEADATEIGPLEARNSPDNFLFYEVNTSVDTVGVWTFTVSVDSDLGSESVDFPIKVSTPSPIFKVFTWVTVVLFMAFVGLVLFPYLRQRARRGRRRRPRRRRRS